MRPQRRSTLRPTSSFAPRIAALGVSAAALLLAPTAKAEGTALRADLLEPKAIKLDGVPKEWPEGLVNLGYALKGRSGKPDFAATGTMAYDGNSVYVALDVTDDVLKPGGDHAAIVIGFPGGTTHEIELYPGDPGKTAGKVLSGGTPLAGAKIVEAPRSGGWSLEASFPWSAFPEAKTVRIGLRGAILAFDADGSGSVDKEIGTAPSTAYASLPAISMEPEQSLADGLLHDKGIRGAPKYNILADVVGDALKERVLVFDRYLVVLGPGFRGGKEYYWNDMGIDGSMIPSVEARDLTGDGQSEIVFHKRFGTGGKWRELLQVLSFGSSQTPSPIFQHEIAITSDASSVVNEVSFLADGAKTAIKIEAGHATGWNAGNYHEPTEGSLDPVLLPWGTIKSQTYKLTGAAFAKAAEEKQAATTAPVSAAPEPTLPKAPPPPSASELQKEVLDLYKKERGASGKPRFDFMVDAHGGAESERVMLFDRDLVIFGKGYRGGTSYSFLTLSQFAAPADIVEMTARDLTGDGKAELIVKGVLHMSAPKGSAVSDTVDREVLVVYQVGADGLKRIFAAETGRAVGKKRVADTVTFLAKGIEIAPGKATDWTEKTYPFNQDTAAVGGYEPLLLPWGSAAAVKYKWSASGFSK